MRLLDKMLPGLIKRGELTVIDPAGKTHRFGAPDPELEAGHGPADGSRRSPATSPAIPGLGTAETFMDGRLVIEEGEIIDLVNIIRGNRRWEDSEGPTSSSRRPASSATCCSTLNWKSTLAKRTSRTITTSATTSTGSSSTPTCNIAAPISPIPSTRSSRPSSTRRRISPPSCGSSRGMKVLDIGCGWGGLALYLNQVADVDVLGVTLSKEQLAVARQRAEEAGVSDRVKFELIDYRDVTGRFDRVVSIGMFEHLGQPFYRTFSARSASFSSRTAWR